MRAHAAAGRALNNISYIPTLQARVSPPYLYSNQVYPLYDNTNRGFNPDSFILPPPSYENVVKNSNNLKN